LEQLAEGQTPDDTSYTEKLDGRCFGAGGRQLILFWTKESHHRQQGGQRERHEQHRRGSPFGVLPSMPMTVKLA
jgi:hypothetical protein